jgi:hypothetical protein
MIRFMGVRLRGFVKKKDNVILTRVDGFIAERVE